MADLAQLRRHLQRQVDHWCRAARQLAALDDIAGAGAWKQLEEYLGIALREHLRGVATRTIRRSELLRTALAAADSTSELALVRRDLIAFRSHYLRAETTIDFFADAINSRTNPTQGAVLRALDTIVHRSMSAILDPLGYETPVALTYIDKGLGASILKAGLRLWDGGAVSPAAAIKVVWHNLARPTSVIHEAGHQVAHIAGWNQELARGLHDELGADPLARVWASWASEISADAVAFVHTGYGAVLALHDVLAGEPSFVFQLIPGDPHPMSLLRVALGIEMCRLAWGAGPWDELERDWFAAYPLAHAPAASRALIEASLPMLPSIARVTLATPMRALRDRALVDVVSPNRVSPHALAELERKLGPAIYTSPHWLWTECLRLLALSALAGDTNLPSGQSRPSALDWMLRLGGAQPIAA